MNDKKDCEIFAKRSPILIDYKFSSTPQIVCVQGHDFPGRTALIRIDGNAPIRTGENGCVSAQQVMDQLKAGTKVSTRKTHWPYDQNRDQEGDLVGLGEAMQLLEYIRSRIQSPA
ncbi:hypothetical protein GOZ97_22675 [Agrobacterium vitis]|uniref:hypothetical protein n=1 Tax=Rhizobium/Agrobacterium group TaxID=227290 RepID=UPI0008DBF2C2|nr:MULTISPECIES: hypothetical protein [Rhizobium/Agrobacterium group]MCF1436834.1 hypothetical protein [Allorhizobium ampelinum]MUO92273.1 hypothetical protein [Agrobacterium vitis]MUZ55094.1 hypothetical protein [Agrobacterium vitis]MUZ94229.1 hypothetical protein [Agrobacterium vitis]MVA42964.1 hypothetical protein [Agrobacterium vitis]